MLNPIAERVFQRTFRAKLEQQSDSDNSSYLSDMASRAVLRVPHPKQISFIESKAKRKVIRAGRRGGKTVGAARIAADAFIAGRRILYATPTAEQVDAFWFEIKQAFHADIESGALYKNETAHILEVPGTKIRIRAKTAWNADTLRGDYADLLILDEFQLMNESAWDTVGAPMLIDNNGDAVFIYTPPSLRSRSVTKADDPQHAPKMFKRAAADEKQAISEGREPRWATFHFRSRDNPHVSEEAINELAKDMTAIAYRMEIEAEDVDEAPGALWTRAMIEANRHHGPLPTMRRIVVAIDPSATSTGDEAGIVVNGRAGKDAYVLEDNTVQGSPSTWAQAAVDAYHKYKANTIVAESNNGGEMVELTIHTIDKDVPVKLVHASRGKQTRAEPISALYEKNRIHHVGKHEALEDEMCLWLPGNDSPNRLDANVWGLTDLMLDPPGELKVSKNPFFG